MLTLPKRAPAAQAHSPSLCIWQGLRIQSPTSEFMCTGILRHAEAFHVVLFMCYHVLSVYMCQAVSGLHTLASHFKTTL